VQLNTGGPTDRWTKPRCRCRCSQRDEVNCGKGEKREKAGKAGKRAEKWKCDRVYYEKKPLLKLLTIKYLLIRMIKSKLLNVILFLSP